MTWSNNFVPVFIAWYDHNRWPFPLTVVSSTEGQIRCQPTDVPAEKLLLRFAEILTEDLPMPS